MQQVYLNGEFVDHEQARIPVEERGFNFADGIYEVMRIVGGRGFRIEAHLDRLVGGAEALEIPLPIPRDEIGAAMLETARRNGVEEGIIYLQLTRGTGPRAHAFPQQARPTLVMLSKPFPRMEEVMRQRGVSAITEPDIRWGLCEVKTIGLLPNILAGERARRAGAYEAILVRGDVVTEGSRSTVFVAKDGLVRTHPVDNILPGVTRGLILDVLRDDDIEVREEAVPLEAVRSADEIFLTGTTTEVLPVVRLDGEPIGEESPGPIARRAHELYVREIESTRSGGGG